MPLQKCQNNGKSGWKFGDSGKCYTGPGSREKARKQGAAIEISKKQNSTSSICYYTSKDKLMEEFKTNLLSYPIS